MISKYLAKSNKVILTPAILLSLASPACFAQEMPGAAISGPVDIQAQEQEFAQDHVVAKGAVRVVYKESIINAPQAIMYKDATGNLRSAVFTGHPNLVQGNSKLDADTITFEMLSQKVLAEGHAHSEVISSGDPKKEGKSDANKSMAINLSGGKPVEKPAGTVERIITDSDKQEYDQGSGKFIAIGHVHVKNGDITASADKLQLMYGVDKKPETAIFTGNAVATQNRNSTSADSITYFMSTKRLQATGHVKSQVIQPKKKAEAPKPNGQPGILDVPAMAAEVQEVPIVITSDSQDLTQDNGRITANGNVHVYYDDTTGIGPKIVVLRNPEGKAEKVYFVGRSQVSQDGSRWIDDRITMTVATKKILAEGNTKAFILNGPQKKPSIQEVETQLASRFQNANQSISSTKIERPQ
ncbi:MAG: hypothetical protein K2X29_04155 [Candidatus Obscuribacterales bacterium]|nr:hypothetical protein [Candidatus Obscuribacterales bacterium]